MRTLLIIFFTGILTVDLLGQSVPIVDKKDTVITVIDSLLDYTYDIKDMTLFLNEAKVDFSVVFDLETNKKRPQYRQIHTAVTPYDAIRQHGEKYRKGLVIYQKTN